MTNHWARRGATALLSLLLLSSLTHAQAEEGRGCGEEPFYYQQKEYRVRRVQIDTPLGWLFGSVKEEVNKILSDPKMPVKAGKLFDLLVYSKGITFINDKFPDLEVIPRVRFATSINYPILRDCDSRTKTLDVVYRIYRVSHSGYLSRVFESERGELSRGVAQTPATKKLAKYFVRPFGGYNRSRDVYGGTRLSVRPPDSFVDELNFEASGSSSGAVAEAEATGSNDYDRGFIRHTEWRAEYSYSDVPTNAAELKQGAARGQFMAATRPYGSGEFVARFGGAVEGGNKQTDLDPARVLPGDVPRSGYRSAKAFVGATWRAGRHAFKGSYGLQLGNAGRGLSVDYVKQVFDVAANLRFLPRDHRPVTLDAQFTAGVISTPGRLPTAERFFGGNVERNFIAGSDWVIRSDPFIRSFPQNRFAQVSGAGFVGGDRFFSLNLTLAPTVWGYPLVPSEILDDCAEFQQPGAAPPPPVAAPRAGSDVCLSFDDLIEIAMNGSKNILRDAYFADTDEYRAVAGLVEALLPSMNRLEAELMEAMKLTDPAVVEAVGSLYQPPEDEDSLPGGSFARAHRIAKEIVDGLKERTLLRTSVPELAVQTGKPSSPRPSRIELMSEDLEALIAVLPQPQSDRVRALRGDIDMRGAKIKADYQALDQNALFAVAERKAVRDMAFPKRVVKELTHEANLIAVSPVMLFDAARLWQRGPGAGDVRYAAGGGARVSFLSIDLTTGYAWNVRPKPWEGRGALLFTMELSNLFR